MNAKEIREVDGGIIPLLIAGAAYLVEYTCYALAADLIINFDYYTEKLEDKMNNCSN